MKTIALETSDTPGSIALLDGSLVIVARALPADQRTTASFAVVLRDALRDVGWRPKDVELFAVCQGPGSFTGLRIGVTAAKTFAYATGCRLVALNTLDVIAQRAASDHQPVWALLDAQRGQLFVAQYERADGRLEERTPTQLVDARSWLATLDEGSFLTGPGLKKWAASVPPNIAVAPPELWNADAATLGQMAVPLAAAGHTVDPWRLVPRYYRSSAAEEKWARRS